MQDRINKIVSEKIRRNAKLKKVEIKQLAEHADIPISTLNSYLYNYRPWGLSAFVKCCAILCTDPGTLMPRHISRQNQALYVRARVLKNYLEKEGMYDEEIAEDELNDQANEGE